MSQAGSQVRSLQEYCKGTFFTRNGVLWVSNLQQAVNLWRVTKKHLFVRVYSETGTPFFEGICKGFQSFFFCKRVNSDTGAPSFSFFTLSLGG